MNQVEFREILKEYSTKSCTLEEIENEFPAFQLITETGFSLSFLKKELFLITEEELRREIEDALDSQDTFERQVELLNLFNSEK